MACRAKQKASMERIEKMIHVFGDSFTYGYNFLKQGHTDFKNMVYPYFLSQKLNTPVVNHSYPGSNNWRIGRKILSLNLNPDDLVIIAWTPTDRFELGVGDNHISIFDKVITVEDNNLLYNKYNFSSLDELQFFDDTVVNVVIKDDDVYTRQFFPWGTNNKIKNHHFRAMYKYAYTHFGTTEWLQEMFLQIFCSTVYKLRMAKCKFRMFNTFTLPYEKSKNTLLEIPEYIPEPYMDMTGFLRYGYEKRIKPAPTYWSVDEHLQVADMIIDSLNKE